MFYNITRIMCLLFLLTIAGCNNKLPENAFALDESSHKAKALQSRVFDTKNEEAIMTAGANVLQDLGYMIEESSTKLGVIVAAKARETDNKAERVFIHTLAILNAALGGSSSKAGVDKHQQIRVAFITKPVSDKVNARVTFQRQVWDLEENLTRQETLHDPQIYTGFFEKLSKSVFLEAHKV